MTLILTIGMMPAAVFAEGNAAPGAPVISDTSVEKQTGDAPSRSQRGSTSVRKQKGSTVTHELVVSMHGSIYMATAGVQGATKIADSVYAVQEGDSVTVTANNVSRGCVVGSATYTVFSSTRDLAVSGRSVTFDVDAQNSEDPVTIYIDLNLQVDNANGFYKLEKSYDSAKGSMPVKINYSSDSTGIAKEGDVVEFEAVAKDGYAAGKMGFNIEGGRSYINMGSTDSLNFKMPAANVTLYAEFGRPHTITVKSVGDGTVSGVQDGKIAAEGRLVVFTSSAKSSSVFQTTTVTNGYGYIINTDNANDFFYMPDRDVTITSYFAKKGSGHAIASSIQRKGAAVADYKNAAAGTRISVTVDPAELYVLDKLTYSYTPAGANEVTVDITGDRSFTMPDADVSIGATFIQDPAIHDIVCSSTSNGRLTCDHQNAREGTLVHFDPQPEKDYVLDKLTYTYTDAGGSEVTEDITDSLSLTMPDADVHVRATFIFDPSLHFIYSSAHFGYMVPEPHYARAGDTVTLKAHANISYYSFSSLSYTYDDRGTQITHDIHVTPGNDTYTMIMPDADVMLNPVFEPYGTKYQIRYDDAGMSHCSAPADLNETEAYAGEDMTLHIQADSGYVVTGVTVTAEDGEVIAAEQTGERFWRFIMPAQPVTVEAIAEPGDTTALSSLTLRDTAGSEIPISPVFNPNTLHYTAKVDASVDKVIVDAETLSTKATITSGNGRHDLATGVNELHLYVRFQVDPGTYYTRAYLITVVRGQTGKEIEKINIVAPGTVRMSASGETNLTVAIIHADIQPADATHKKLIWKVSNDKIKIANQYYPREGEVSL